VEKSECSHVMTSSKHVYEVQPRKDKRDVDLISDALPFGRLWYGGQAQSFRILFRNQNRGRATCFGARGLRESDG
jgi:hypothetical protein